MKKRLPIVLLSLLLTITFLGCGKMSMDSYTNINKDGSGDFTFQLAYDDIMAAISKQGFLNSDKLINQGFQVSKYIKGNNNIEEVKYKFNKLNDINKLLENSDYLTLKVDKKAKLTSDRYTININFNKSLAEKIEKSNADTTKPTSEEVKQYISSIVLTNQINVPGKIIESNNTDKTENTLVWSYRLGQIDKNTSMDITYELQNNKRITYLVTGILILTGVATASYIVLKRKN